jgi:glycerol-3-phosphate acyltransferase PlsY
MPHFLSIILSYLIGSIPFSYIIAKVWGVDLKKEVKNGHIGAGAVRKNCGLFPAILAGTGDFGKGALVIYLAKKISGQEWIIVLAGLFVIIGHNWSIFLKLWGGKGALVTLGSLFYLLTLPFLLSLPLIIPFLLIKRKEIFKMRTTSFFTGLGYLLVSILSFVFGFPPAFSLSPIIFSLPMIFKKNY